MRAALARAPLAVHAAWGAAVCGGLALLERAATPEHPESDADIEALFDSPLLTSLALGAVRGAAFRWWYPAVERWASRARTPHGGVALAALLDTLPTQLGQAAVWFVHTSYYKLAFGRPYDADDALQEVGRRIVAGKIAQMGGGRSAEEANGSGSRQDAGIDSGDAIDDDEFEQVLASIFESELSAANPLTALVSLLNFLVVPRWGRGLVGVCQASLYDAVSLSCNEANHQVLVVPVPVPVPEALLGLGPGSGGSGSSRGRRGSGELE